MFSIFSMFSAPPIKSLLRDRMTELWSNPGVTFSSRERHLEVLSVNIDLYSSRPEYKDLIASATAQNLDEVILKLVNVLDKEWSSNKSNTL